MKLLFGVSAWIGVMVLTRILQAGEPALEASTNGVPKIQFETNFFDFGKITTGEKLSGFFKFKNAGTGTLKIEPPQASCECTEPRVKPDILAPGQTGEIIYTVKLERPLTGQRMIHVRSNDPETPHTQLIIQLEYVPLYEIEPKSLRITLPAGTDEAQKSFSISRTDGKPLDIERFTASEEWINTAFDPASKAPDGSSRVNVTVHRPPGPPLLINATIHLWSSNQPAAPVQSVALTGEVLGELAAIPPRLYWVIPDFGTNKANYPSEALTRTIQLVSVLGHDVELKKVSSGIAGMSVQVLPKQPGKSFDLLLKFDELPETFTNASLRIETSLASLPMVEVPMTIAVASGK